MKKRTDPRHRRRQKTVQRLFEWWFYREHPKRQKEVLARNPKSQSTKLAGKILKHLKEIDDQIVQAAQEWPIEGIARVDLSILRLAVYELLFDNTAPPKVIVDESVELAKELGGESSPAFINGVLGKIISVHGDRITTK